jgi:hypothetical protein
MVNDEDRPIVPDGVRIVHRHNLRRVLNEQ